MNSNHKGKKKNWWNFFLSKSWYFTESSPQGLRGDTLPFRDLSGLYSIEIVSFQVLRDLKNILRMNSNQKEKKNNFWWKKKFFQNFDTPDWLPQSKNFPSCRPKCCELSRLGIESWFFGESFLIVILWFPEVNMIIPDRFHMFLSCKNYFSFYGTTKTSKRCFRITSSHPSLMVCKSVEIWSLFIHFFQNRWLLLIVFV